MYASLSGYESMIPTDVGTFRWPAYFGDEERETKAPQPLGAKMKLARTGCIILLSGTLAGSAIGQEAPQSELQTILETLETNRKFYRSHIPAFFCSEHVVSRLDWGGHLEHKQVSVTDAVFRLTRIDTSNEDPDLVESRSEMKINGSPSTRTDLEGPVVLANVFSRGLDYVSLSQKGCASYSVVRSPGNQSKDLENVHFESIQGHLGSPECVFAEAVSGVVTFDGHLHEVTQINATVPHHLIARPDYFGRWDLSVDYAPVSLGGHTYWLPQRITSTLVPLEEDDAAWRFTATYSGFHKYEVQSHILPSTKTVNPAP